MSAGERSLASVVGLIRSGQETGLIDATINPRLASNLVFNTIGRHFRWYRADGDAPIDEVADLCARYAIGGLTGRPV